MSECFVGEIRMFAGNYAPEHWAKCDGQLESVQQNQMLFSLIGNMYGGDGVNTFALPDLRGRVPVGQGQGVGLTPRVITQKAGTETVTVTTDQLPVHTHTLMASNVNATATSPQGNVFATVQPGTSIYGLYTTTGQSGGGAPVLLDDRVLTPTGGNQAHDNMMPSATLTFIIALMGTYPQRQS